jgi:hypothetical protein
MPIICELYERCSGSYNNQSYLLFMIIIIKLIWLAKFLFDFIYIFLMENK